MRIRRGATASVLGAVAFALPIAAAVIQPAKAQQSSASTGDRSASPQSLIDGPQRSASNRARDRYRNPGPVLTFCDVTADSHIIEILPGSAGYWTEILAPLVKHAGRYTAAIPKPNPDLPDVMKGIGDFKAKLAADPVSFERVATTDFVADGTELVVAGSASHVLTFRNLHNWMATGRAEQVLAASYRALRPGGILCIEEHRGRSDEPQDPKAKSGYIREDYAREMIERVGFRFVASSDVNANPRDTKDYSVGVWALPPTYRLKDQDREKYAAIGESDRFLMKFVRP